MKGPRLFAIGIGVAAAVFLGANEVLALLGGGALGMLWLRMAEREKGPTAGALVPAVAVGCRGSPGWLPSARSRLGAGAWPGGGRGRPRRGAPTAAASGVGFTSLNVPSPVAP